MLSETEKKTYRSLLFRHIDGISLIGPISQLYKSNMVDFIISNDSSHCINIKQAVCS